MRLWLGRARLRRLPVAFKRLRRPPLRLVNRARRNVRLGIHGVGLGRPPVAIKGLALPVEARKDVPPANVRARVVRLDLDGPVVLGERSVRAAGLR